MENVTQHHERVVFPSELKQYSQERSAYNGGSFQLPADVVSLYGQGYP